VVVVGKLADGVLRWCSGVGAPPLFSFFSSLFPYSSLLSLFCILECVGMRGRDWREGLVAL
jgi:hypothetical protein